MGSLGTKSIFHCISATTVPHLCIHVHVYYIVNKFQMYFLSNLNVTGQLFCLQARPIVTLPPSCFFEGEKGGAATLWDNSNIVESYSGVTSPLTFSFASYAYEMVSKLSVAHSGKT